MDKYNKAAKQLNEFTENKRRLYMRQLITAAQYYDSVTGYIQALVDNDLIGEGYGENVKVDVRTELYG